MHILKLSLLTLVFVFSGCATILSGNTENLTFQTNPSGAHCELQRKGRVIGSVATTPGNLMIDKTKHDITVVCKKDGYQDATGYLKSGTDGSTFVNILAGGVIGWGIDSASGSDNKYPEVTTISMVPLSQQLPTGQQHPPKTEAVKVDAMTNRGTQPEMKTNKVSASSEKNSIEAKIRQLDDLKSKDLISDEEYKKAKADLLAKI